MQVQPVLFPKIKALVHEIVPDAKVLLFGSQAAGTATKESDWDVLVLTQQEVSWEFKKSLQHKLFPLSIEAEAFFNLLVVQEEDWISKPSYYALRRSVTTAPVVL